MQLLLIEPILYLLISIADYADINDYILYDGEDTDPEAQIHGDDVEPITMDDDDETEETKPMVEPTEEVVSESLLSRIKTDLPKKIEEIKENK